MKQTITPINKPFKKLFKDAHILLIFISVSMYGARKLLIFCSEIYFTRLIFPMTNLKMPNLQQK